MAALRPAVEKVADRNATTSLAAGQLGLGLSAAAAASDGLAEVQGAGGPCGLPWLKIDQ